MTAETPKQKPKKPGILAQLWNLAVSPVVFVVLACLWCLDLGIGSILAFKRDPQFWMKMDSVPFNVWLDKFAPSEMPHSLWVYILVVLTWLVMLSLAACAVGWFVHRRARKRTLAEALLHLGFGLVFIGFLVGGGWGDRVQGIALSPGESADLPSLGLKLTLDSVEIQRDEEKTALDTISNVTVTDGAGALLAKGSARLNHPLIHGTTVVYPEGGDTRTVGGEIEIEGVGRVQVKNNATARLPDGSVLRVRGSLEDGQRYSRYVGPGVFITIGDERGNERAGTFFGSHPMFQTGGLEALRVSFIRPVTATMARFNVHRDPGVQFVLLGAVLLTLGTFWALGVYLKRGDTRS